ncbi:MULTISPECIES: Arc family DNA-binding protein [unclassified Acinetobacter]|uniref:Arc family DNA-binding protein n=1 Tax=unclassified Acinetobacter TaxID=196816 RepID=UPI0015D3785B|nr:MULTISPECIES: Arc family DNA-binding protein [unclassified Acinetobacter]
MSENQKEPQYKLRWSEELRDKVVESAKQHSRSINAEICTRLEQSFDEPMAFDPTDAEMVTKLVAQSMQSLLVALRDRGVSSDLIFDALREVSGSKKAP